MQISSMPARIRNPFFAFIMVTLVSVIAFEMNDAFQQFAQETFPVKYPLIGGSQVTDWLWFLVSLEFFIGWIFYSIINKSLGSFPIFAKNQILLVGISFFIYLSLLTLYYFIESGEHQFSLLLSSTAAIVLAGNVWNFGFMSLFGD